MWTYPVLLLSFCLPKALSITGISGDYKTTLLSMRSLDSDLDKVTYNFRIRKYNKTVTVMQGSMTIHEEIGPLAMKINMEKYGNGGYKKFLFDDFRVKNLCKSPHHMELLANFENMDFTPDCTVKPMKTRLKPFVVDTLLHRHMNKTFYGKFRFGCLILENDSSVFGYEVEIEFTPI